MSGVVDTILNGGKAAFDATSEWVMNHPYTSAGIAAFLILPSISNAVEKFVWPNTVLELDLESLIVTHNEPGPWHHLFGEGSVASVKRIVSVIDAAAADTKVKGLIVRLGSLPAIGGLAAIDEIRSSVKNFVKQGKVAVAYGDSFGEFSRAAGAYYLATAFSHIYIAPCGDVNLTEFAVEAPFVRGALDKLGVLPRVSARKQYKNFANMFTEEKFTEAHKEATSSLLNSFRGHVFAEMAAARNLTVAQVETIFREGPYSGKEALEKKLIDGLMYRDEVYDHLKTLIKATPKLLFLFRYQAKRGFLKNYYNGKPVIAYINLCGSIHRGNSKQDMSGTVSSIGSDTVCRALRAATKDPRVKAIILHIDSGGGSYVASDVIAREVLCAKKAGKKVISCMSNVAASGGYFVSLYADKIVAQPTTITGSIGVLVGKFVTPGLWSKLGINWDQVHGGTEDSNKTNAQMFSTLKDYSEEEKKCIETMLDRIYADFTGKVAVGRKLSPEKVEEVAKGRVWTGLQAKENGLVDEIGGLYTAVSVAKKEAGIPDAEHVKIEAFPKPMSLLQKLNKPENSEEQVTAGIDSPSIPSVSQVRGALTAPLWAAYPLSFFHDNSANISQYDVAQIAMKALNASNTSTTAMGPLSLEMGAIAM